MERQDVNEADPALIIRGRAWPTATLVRLAC